MKSLSVKTLNAAMGVAIMPEILVLVHYIHVDNCDNDTDNLVTAPRLSTDQVN